MVDRVRMIQYDELDKLLDLYIHLNPKDPDVKGLDSIKSIWNDIFEDPNLYYFVIEEDCKLVSSCTMAIIKNLTRGGCPYSVIENVVTHEDYRRKGYGKAILEKSVEVSREKNCYKVMLMTGRKDENVLKFYEDAGFDRGIKTGFIKRLEKIIPSPSVVQD